MSNLQVLIDTTHSFAASDVSFHREYPLHMLNDEDSGDSRIQCQCGTQVAVETDDDSFVGNPFDDPLYQLKQKLAEVYDRLGIFLFLFHGHFSCYDSLSMVFLLVINSGT
jgi:hypothetical protein